MHAYVRTGIVALAGTVAFGTAGFAVANAGSETGVTTAVKDTVVKREDTSSAWVQSTNLDDDPDDRSDRADDADSPTSHTGKTKHTKNTKNTKNTKDTKNSKNTRNTGPTRDTAGTGRG